MTPSLKEQVVAAFETGDQLAIRRLGWWSVWEACSTWWAPRQSCTAMEFVPFAKLLGGEDPEKVLDALRDLCGDWRPTPAQVRGHLHRKTGDESKVDCGRGRDRTARPRRCNPSPTSSPLASSRARARATLRNGDETTPGCCAARRATG